MTRRSMIGTTAALLMIGTAVVIYPRHFGKTTHLLRNKELPLVEGLYPGLKMFADDYSGYLPQTLSELVPGYMSAEGFPRYSADTEFLFPGARLADLPPETVLLRRPFTSENGQVWVAVVRADGSGDLVLQEPPPRPRPTAPSFAR